MQLRSGFRSSVRIWLNASLVLTMCPSFGHSGVCLSSLRSGMPFVFFLSASWVFFPPPLTPRMEPCLPGVHLSGHLSKELAFPHSPQHRPEERVTLSISAWKAAWSPELPRVSPRAEFSSEGVLLKATSQSLSWPLALERMLLLVTPSFPPPPHLLFLLSRVCLQWCAEWFELF